MNNEELGWKAKSAMQTNSERARSVAKGWALSDNVEKVLALEICIALDAVRDAAEARGRKETIDLRNTTVAKVERTQAIKDCIATARAVMLGHEKEGAPLMATGAVTVEMALEAMLGNISAKAEKK